jgi:hypothetical protein
MLNTNTDVWYAIRAAMNARQYRGDNRIAINKNGFCEYRLDREVENIGCAIGVLIPDELYSPDLERAALDRVRGILVNAEVIGPEVDLRVLEDLQSLHDSVRDVESFVRLLDWYFGRHPELFEN